MGIGESKIYKKLKRRAKEIEGDLKTINKQRGTKQGGGSEGKKSQEKVVQKKKKM